MTQQLLRGTYYTVLGLDSSRCCSQEEIKKAYRDLALKLHPDKRKPDADQVTSDDEEFQSVQKAYKVLSNETTRKEYDRSLLFSSTIAVSEEVDLGDMSLEISKEFETYSWPCRCSGSYLISSSDLEEGLEVIPCSGCSLNIRVLYQLQEEEEEHQQQEQESER